MEVARAIKEYKKLVNFEDEVNEATYDAFQKGFAKCKRKVTEALSKLDLDSIVVVEPEPQEEGGEAKATKSPTS